MADPIDLKLIDQRTAQRYLRKGLLDEKEYRKYLESLPDLADRAVEVESRFETGAKPRPPPPEEPPAPIVPIQEGSED